MQSKIAKVVVGLPVDGPFDYTVGKDLKDRVTIGARVRVSFNRRNRIGFVVGSAASSRFKNLNPILSVLDDGPVLDANAFDLAKAFSEYYGCSLGEAIETFLPKALRRGKSALQSPPPQTERAAGRTTALSSTLVIDRTRFDRWPLIRDEIRKVIDDGKRIIVLVPEASLIKQAVAALTEAFPCPLTVFDKKLPAQKELAQWEAVRDGQFTIVVGTRSTVFAPLPDCGLIVIDEEEHDAYKQEQVPHYRVHEVAAMRQKIEGCRLMLISSLPTVETWEEARKAKWTTLTVGDTAPAKVQIVDMTNYNPRKTSIISFPLQSAIQKALEAGEKTLLFMNRVGFSTRTHCQQCGHTLRCERCDVNLTYLYSRKKLVCRHCNYQRELPKICPECRGAYLKSTGTGAEKLESETARLFPSARITHYDRDSKNFPKGYDIMIATQAVFRRQDRWSVALSAMLNFDAQLYRMDFRSGHKALALLVHLSQITSDKLLVQTRMADNDCLKAIKSMNFDRFYRQELKQRRELKLPPFRHLVALGLRGKKEENVLQQATALYEALKAGQPKAVEISEPHPDVNPKLRDKYRFTIVCKGKSVKAVLAHIKKVLKAFKRRSVIITINVDP